MSKNKTNLKIQVPNEPTRKQLSRAQRDARQRRRINLAVGGVLLLIVAIVVGGFLYETLSRQYRLSQPVADVNGELISTTDFQSRVRLTRAQLRSQENFYRTTLGNADTADQILAQLNDPVALGGQVVNAMVDELLLKQAAAEFTVSVSPDDIDAAIEENFGYERNPPTPAPTRTPPPTPTAAAVLTQTATPSPTPFPTATPISKDSAMQSYQQYLSAVGVTDQDYRKYIEMNLISEKVREAIGTTAPTTTEQIKFRFISIVDASVVPTVTAALDKDGFPSIYQAILSGTVPYTSGVFAQEVDQWVPRDVISSELGSATAETFFSAPLSQTTVIVSNTTSAGTINYYVGWIMAKGVEPLASNYLDQAKQNAVEAWLQQRRNLNFIKDWSDRVPTTP